MGWRMSGGKGALRQITVFHFISDPGHPLKFRGNCLELLNKPHDGMLQLFESDGEPVMLINLEDVSHAEVVYG